MTRYVESVGSIDQALAGMLAKRGTISKTDTAEEDAKESLAKTVLSASAVLPSADLRARLVQSLELAKYLDVNELPVEKGELFARLLERDVITDDAVSYERLSATDWPTRKRSFARTSSRTTWLLSMSEGDLGSFLLSAKVDGAVKSAAPCMPMSSWKALTRLD